MASEVQGFNPLVVIVLLIIITYLLSEFVNTYSILRRYSKPRKRRTYGYVYIYRGKYNLFLYKIGYAKSPIDRLRSQRTSMPFGMVLVGLYHSRDYIALEGLLHKELRHFRINPDNEWFVICPKIIFLMLLTNRRDTREINDRL